MEIFFPGETVLNIMENILPLKTVLNIMPHYHVKVSYRGNSDQLQRVIDLGCDSFAISYASMFSFITIR